MWKYPAFAVLLMLAFAAWAIPQTPRMTPAEVEDVRLIHPPEWLLVIELRRGVSTQRFVEKFSCMSVVNYYAANPTRGTATCIPIEVDRRQWLTKDASFR